MGPSQSPQYQYIARIREGKRVLITGSHLKTPPSLRYKDPGDRRFPAHSLRRSLTEPESTGRGDRRRRLAPAPSCVHSPVRGSHHAWLPVLELVGGRITVWLLRPLHGPGWRIDSGRGRIVAACGIQRPMPGSAMANALWTRAKSMWLPDEGRGAVRARASRIGSSRPRILGTLGGTQTPRPRSCEPGSRHLSLFLLCCARKRRIRQAEDHDLFAADGADVVVEARYANPGDLVDHRLDHRPRRFDQLGPDLFEQVPALVTGKRLDQMPFGRGQ